MMTSRLLLPKMPRRTPGQRVTPEELAQEFKQEELVRQTQALPSPQKPPSKRSNENVMQEGGLPRATRRGNRYLRLDKGRLGL
jgi:hypothetical protein